MMRHSRTITVVALFLALLMGAALADGPVDQFKSVIYVREGGAKPEAYEKLKPHSIAMDYPVDFYKWGGQYMYMWYFPHLIDSREAPAKDLALLKAIAADPKSIIWTITPELFSNWENYRAAGIVTGPRPKSYDDLWIVSEKYARAKEEGTELPARQWITYEGRKMGNVCFANPDVVRLMTDIVKFNARCLWNKNIRKDNYMPVNAGFVDLDGYHGCPMDYSEFTRAKYEKWLRATRTPEQIKAVLEVDPAQPIPLLWPKDATPDLKNRYQRMHREFYDNTLLPEYLHTLEKAIDSVLGEGNFHVAYHGEGFWWRVLGGNPHITSHWGDWVDTYCTECAVTPAVKGGDAYYALPNFIKRRVSTVDGNWDNANNVYDYQYAAARLTGEPVIMKTGYKGQPIGRTVASVTLGLAEGMALLGNMRMDLAKDNTGGTKSVPGNRAEPFVAFMHKMTPQVRQMIPAGRVGVVFSISDSWLYRGFAQVSNDRQAYQVSNILQTQHVPLQVVYGTILQETLAQRPMDVLIVPWVRCPSDKLIQALTQYVEGGGRAIFVGECGTLTYDGVPRKPNAFADLLPPADPKKVTYRTVGKGRTAYIAGELDEAPASAQALQAALFELNGRTHSCIPPDKYPLLLANVTRNSDRSRFWMHLVNYDVDTAEPEVAKAVRAIDDLRVVLPLPDGLKAGAVRLYRPEGADVDLTPEQGREGCAVTVPKLGIYALIAVETLPGARPDVALLKPGKATDLAAMVASGFDPAPSDAVLYPPNCPVPIVSKLEPRRFSNKPVVAYFTGGGKTRPSVRFSLEEPRAKMKVLIYGPDGKPMDVPVASNKSANIIRLPREKGRTDFYSMVLESGARGTPFLFSSVKYAVFEASLQAPLTFDEPGDSAPLYFYVPKRCKSFKIHANTRIFWTPHLHPIHLVVKDYAGKVQLDHNGPIDGGWTWERGDKAKPVFEVNVPAGQSGKVWSLWMLDAKGGTKPKSYLQFALSGVPPVVAVSPRQLFIRKEDN